MIAAAAVSAHVALGLAVSRGPTMLDNALASAVDGFASPPLAAVLASVNAVGQSGVWLALIAVTALAFFARGRRHVAAALALGATSEIAIALSKLLFDRERPMVVVAGGLELGSYPSGHVTRIAVTFGVLMLFAVPQRWRASAMLLVGVFVTLVALARVASLEHWATDTVGAVLLATAWVALIPALMSALCGRSGRRPWY